MREQEESSSTLSTPQQHCVEEGNASISMRDLLHSSNISAATMLLDENHCVVDASPSMLSLLQVRVIIIIGQTRCMSVRFIRAILVLSRELTDVPCLSPLC